MEESRVSYERMIYDAFETPCANITSSGDSLLLAVVLVYPGLEGVTNNVSTSGLKSACSSRPVRGCRC